MADAACGRNHLASERFHCFHSSINWAAPDRNAKLIIHNAIAYSEYGLIPQDTPALLPNYWTALPSHEVMEGCWSETIFMHRFSTAIRLESCNPQATASGFRCCTRVPRVAYSALYG